MRRGKNREVKAGDKTKPSSMPDRVREGTIQMGTCPAGHGLPHRTDKGRCTPIYCPGSRPGKFSTKKRLADAKNTPEDVEHEETKRIEKARGRHRARSAFLQVPEGLKGADAEDFYDQKMVELLPQVAGEIEFDLKYGDWDQREKAKQAVRDSTGRGKREAGLGGGTPMIMLINPSGQGGPLELPWVKRAVLPATRTITSVVVEPVKPPEPVGTDEPEDLDA